MALFSLLLAVLIIVGFLSRILLIQWFSSDFFFTLFYFRRQIYYHFCSSFTFVLWHRILIVAQNLSSMIISCCLIAIKLISPEFYDRMILFNCTRYPATVLARKVLNISIRIQVNIFYAMRWYVVIYVSCHIYRSLLQMCSNLKSER